LGEKWEAAKGYFMIISRSSKVASRTPNKWFLEQQGNIEGEL
jgi:hypothetical protein